MKIESDYDSLRISDLREISEYHAAELHDAVLSSLPEHVNLIELDLSQVRAMNSSGVAVLVAIYDSVLRRQGEVTWRLLNPAPPVRQLLELMRLHRLFEIPIEGAEKAYAS